MSKKATRIEADGGRQSGRREGSSSVRQGDATAAGAHLPAPFGTCLLLRHGRVGNATEEMSPRFYRDRAVGPDRRPPRARLEVRVYEVGHVGRCSGPGAARTLFAAACLSGRAPTSAPPRWGIHEPRQGSDANEHPRCPVVWK
ncbi:hypothetical protein HPB47_007068 [Ixodes persulcatus]|uniref:Uncharacterized protein n=1 Tax=Ixodes persulcatus TaxID=34615 RepID=A0AC60P908_IXOPE|nr:hypothetical protein HPB47_007068 [Ixodes persulcatus]